MSDIRATLLKSFASVYPTPDGVKWNERFGIFERTGAPLDVHREHQCRWEGFQACHPIAYADVVRDCKPLRDAAGALHNYLIDTDDEGLIAHADQMQTLADAIEKFDKQISELH